MGQFFRPGEQEPAFFADPAIDRMFGVLTTLATEHFVLLQRVRALELQLAEQGAVDLARLSAGPTGGEAEAVAADAAQFVATLMEPLLGRLQSASESGSFSLRATAGRRA